MLDTYDLPPSSFATTEVFYFGSEVVGATIDSWQTWVKPRGCSWVYMFAIGGGGGAGMPPAGSSAGGGGGASGAVTKALIPAALLPDTLYVRVGARGPGATTPNTQGGFGRSTYIGTYPLNSAGSNIFIANNGSGGNATTGAGGPTPTMGNYAYLGLAQLINGRSGAAGGAAGSPGVALVYDLNATVGPWAGGAGGAGYNGSTASAGGAVTFSSSYPALTIAGGAGGVGVPGGDGLAGYNRNVRLDFNGPRGASVLFFSPGSGGGCSDTAGQDGGRGGDGGYGCGGSGGGGASATPGAGGDGGDGLAIICAW